jgi:hypothetical protein
MAYNFTSGLHVDDNQIFRRVWRQQIALEGLRQPVLPNLHAFSGPMATPTDLRGTVLLTQLAWPFCVAAS